MREKKDKSQRSTLVFILQLVRHSRDFFKTPLEIVLEIFPYLNNLSARMVCVLDVDQTKSPSRLIYKMHIKDPDSILLRSSCLHGALLCEHVYDCNGCERPDNAPESLAHTPKNLILWSYRWWKERLQRRGCTVFIIYLPGHILNLLLGTSGCTPSTLETPGPCCSPSALHHSMAIGPLSHAVRAIFPVESLHAIHHNKEAAILAMQLSCPPSSQ